MVALRRGVVCDPLGGSRTRVPSARYTPPVREGANPVPTATRSAHGASHEDRPLVRLSRSAVVRVHRSVRSLFVVQAWTTSDSDLVPLTLDLACWNQPPPHLRQRANRRQMLSLCPLLQRLPVLPLREAAPRGTEPSRSVVNGTRTMRPTAAQMNKHRRHCLVRRRVESTNGTRNAYPSLLTTGRTSA